MASGLGAVTSTGQEGTSGTKLEDLVAGELGRQGEVQCVRSGSELCFGGDQGIPWGFPVMPRAEGPMLGQRVEENEADRGVETKGGQLVILGVTPGCVCVCLTWSVPHGNLGEAGVAALLE